MISRVLGSRYEIIELIGEGGMAKVYKARDTKLNRLVAIKILKKEFANNSDIADKFKREATAIANLSDANIVNILDVGHEEEENVDYIIMEYVNGKTLKDLITYNGKLSFNTTLTIGIQIAKALECAHKKNIIHRDVKPQNILVTESGEVKVTDFGIAKSTTSSTITNTTTIMGSAHYLSPEQAKGTFIDFRTDLYSLGIVLYEMVTGKLPFDGESPVTVALKHIQEEPKTPKELNPAVPESLNNLILKAMSKEPINRYENAKEMLMDLQKVKENPDVKINTIESFDNSRTIVMEPMDIKANKSAKIVTKAKFEEDDEDEYEDDYEDDYDDDYEEEENHFIKNKKKRSKTPWIVIGIILTFLLVGGVVFALTLNINKIKEVKMPNIIGENFNDAKSQLEDLGLKIKKTGVENSEKEENTILKCNYDANTLVKEGTTVEVIISGGVEKVKVPGDFRDVDIDTVKKALDDVGLNYTVKEEYSDSFEINRVISQSVKSGTLVEKGSNIDLVVSKGKEIKLVDVINVIGFDLNTGKKKLEDLKLIVDVKEQETDRESENGKILDQTNIDKKVEEGTTITITVGKYVEPTIDVSTLLSVGMNLSDAINILNANNIQYKIAGGEPPKGEWQLYTVTDYTKSIKKNEKVNLTVEKAAIEEPVDPGTETVE